MPKPHPSFRYVRADEVAECWDGVTSDLSRKLWAIAEHQRPIPNLEDSGPFDHVGHENLAKRWDWLSTADQHKLNQLAKENNHE